jgi:hypothetical protein
MAALYYSKIFLSAAAGAISVADALTLNLPMLLEYFKSNCVLNMIY